MCINMKPMKILIIFMVIKSIHFQVRWVEVCLYSIEVIFDFGGRQPLEPDALFDHSNFDIVFIHLAVEALLEGQNGRVDGILQLKAFSCLLRIPVLHQIHSNSHKDTIKFQIRNIF